MSWNCVQWAFAQPIPPVEQHVLIWLANHAHKDGSNARPNRGRLASESGWSEKTIIRALQELEGKQLIEATERANKWARRATVYRLLLDNGVNGRSDAAFKKDTESNLPLLENGLSVPKTDSLSAKQDAKSPQPKKNLSKPSFGANAGKPDIHDTVPRSACRDCGTTDWNSLLNATCEVCRAGNEKQEEVA